MQTLNYDNIISPTSWRITPPKQFHVLITELLVKSATSLSRTDRFRKPKVKDVENKNFLSRESVLCRIEVPSMSSNFLVIRSV